MPYHARLEALRVPHKFHLLAYVRYDVRRSWCPASSLPNVSSSLLFSDEVTTTPDVQPSDASPFGDAQFNDDAFHLDA